MPVGKLRKIYRLIPLLKCTTNAQTILTYKIIILLKIGHLEIGNDKFWNSYP